MVPAYDEPLNEHGPVFIGVSSKCWFDAVFGDDLHRNPCDGLSAVRDDND